MAERRGLALRKSRRRDSSASDYGSWYIVDSRTAGIVAGTGTGRPSWTIDDVEGYLVEQAEEKLDGPHPAGSYGWQADHDLVFAHPATGGPLSKHQNLRRFRRALKAAGLDESHVFHDLRHTFGTQMAAVGTPLRTLEEWMGHRDLTTTQRYADYAPSGRDAELIDAAFGRGTNGGTNLSESQVTSAN